MYTEERNKGFAFVSMGTHEQAVAALTNLESTEFEGRILKLKWAKLKNPKPSTMPNPPNPPKPPAGHNLFVANIAYKAGVKDLKDFFNANNANVVSGKIIYHDNPRRPSGYGFVAFNTEAEAEAAIVAFDGKEFMGRQIRVRRSKRFFRQATKATVESESAQVA